VAQQRPVRCGAGASLTLPYLVRGVSGVRKRVSVGLLACASSNVAPVRCENGTKTCHCIFKAYCHAAVGVVELLISIVVADDKEQT
jgi:hypothetical protein